MNSCRIEEISTSPPESGWNRRPLQQFGRIPWSKKYQPTPVFLPGKSHGERRLWTTVHGVPKNQTQLSTHTHTRITSFTLPLYLPLFFLWKMLHPNVSKMVHQDTRSSSSQSAGFPNEITNPYPCCSKKGKKGEGVFFLFFPENKADKENSEQALHCSFLLCLLLTCSL